MFFPVESEISTRIFLRRVSFSGLWVTKFLAAFTKSRSLRSSGSRPSTATAYNASSSSTPWEEVRSRTCSLGQPSCKAELPLRTQILFSDLCVIKTELFGVYAFELCVDHQFFLKLCEIDYILSPPPFLM